MKTINFIGAGKLGSNLAQLLITSQVGTVQGICNSRLSSAKNVVLRTGQGTAYQSIEELPGADITFITTPDQWIETVCVSLSNSSSLKAGSIVVHCSGLLNSDILGSVRKKHCLTASIHPMYSFAEMESSLQNFSGTLCALEGDENARIILNRLFGAMGAKVFNIAAAAKPAYHAAGVFASNHMVGLFQQALTCLDAARVPREHAIDSVLSLMQNTLDNLARTRSAKAALTGPVQRGDIDTVKQHLSCLGNTNLIRSYCAAGMEIIDIADLSQESREEFKKLFAGNSCH